MDINKDANFIAYQEYLEEGKLEKYQGQWVAFYNGKFFGSNSNQRILLEGLNNCKGDRLIKKVLKESEKETLVSN